MARQISVSDEAYSMLVKIKRGRSFSKVIMGFIGEHKKPDPKNFLKVKPFDWGKGTENTSTEIDRILYK